MTVVRRSAYTPFSPEQIFDLVNDVASYPDFLPWCEAAEIHSVSEAHMQARLKVRRGQFNHAFTTSNTLQPGRAIKLSLVDGPFRSFAGQWRFEPADGGCVIYLDMEFEFASKLLGMALTAAFKPIADSLVKAFRDRAYEVYGV